MPTRTFEQWVDGIFDHPVVEPAWYWALDADTCVEPDDETNAGYLARLFTESDRVLARFDDTRVGQGLNMIAHNACSDHAFSIVAGTASWPTRSRAIRSIFDLYANCFAARCVPALGHLGGLTNPLNTVCYMWWDLFPAWPDPNDASRAAEADEYLGVMERCLTLTHDACLEGALHGLGHWRLLFPERVEAIIDQFLKSRNDLHPELLIYARQARNGAVV